MTAPGLRLWPTRRRVERTAWNAIRRCVKAKGLDALPLPIPVEQWIEGPLGIEFSIEDLSHVGPNVLGVADTRKRQISVSDALVNQDARFRFTAAHELGHVLLHAKRLAVFHDTDDPERLLHTIEREAERFAAAFLIPAPALAPVFTRVTMRLGQDPESLLMAVSNGEAKAWETFRTDVLPALTKRFGVSMSAAAHRFSDLTLDSGEPALPFDIASSFLPKPKFMSLPGEE